VEAYVTKNDFMTPRAILRLYVSWDGQNGNVSDSSDECDVKITRHTAYLVETTVVSDSADNKVIIVYH
jgi:hypothetical protein